MVKQCPCNSKKNYAECCEPYIVGKEKPITAEKLMRSRYTAYTQANIPYIQATMCGKAAEGFEPEEAKQWAESVKWLGLKVKRAFPHATDPSLAYVEFVATYSVNGKAQKIIELSEFERNNTTWFYIDKIE